MTELRSGKLAAVAAVVALLATGCEQPPADGTQGVVEARSPAPGATPLTDLLPDQSERSAASAASDQLMAGRATAIVRATARVAPAVVSISVIRTEQVRARTFWESMMLPPGAQRRSAGYGSGVIVRGDGIVLTNDHVITGADRIQVTLSNGVDVPATVIGSDPVADVAVLRITGENLPVAPVGTATGLLVGEWAIAIGNPLGNYVGDSQPTVTAGVVSAANRNITPTSEDEGFYFGMIQTDAAINPGNSGGALVNADGEVIGINASILSRGGGSEGLGFAIPIDRAMKIADDMIQFGEVRRAWVGLDVEPAGADEWGRSRGVRISRVAPGSPAAAAGIEVGDHLLVADQRALAGPFDWEGVLLDLREGDELTVEILRTTTPIVLTATAFPSMTAERISVLEDLELITVSPQIQVERGLLNSQGALVASISDQLGRQMGGLAEGDVIVAINRRQVGSAQDVRQAFEVLAGTGRIQLYVERNGDYRFANFIWRAR